MRTEPQHMPVVRSVIRSSSFNSPTQTAQRISSIVYFVGRNSMNSVIHDQQLSSHLISSDVTIHPCLDPQPSQRAYSAAFNTMDRPPRRIRFYKPHTEEALTPAPESLPPVPQSRTLGRRFQQTQPSSNPVSGGSTPVSKSTPDTLRTLELNWRERRRAKLEDITLQRAMGVVESTEGEKTDRKAKNENEESPVTSSGISSAQVNTRTRPTSKIAFEPVGINPNSRRTNSTGTRTSSYGVKAEASRTRNHHTTTAAEVEDDHPATSNNTTSHSRTNKARKLVKLVRDARLSVQPSPYNGELKPQISHTSATERAQSVQKPIPISEKRRPPTGVTPMPPSSSSPTAPKKNPGSRLETSATPRKVSEIRRVAFQAEPERPKGSTTRRSPRSRWPVSPSTRTLDDTLRPITASPLPAREYLLSATSSLVIYPYGQDWSIDPDTEERSTAKRIRKRPIMSALTGSERMDILDEGMTMRIKPLKLSFTSGSAASRYLELKDVMKWSRVDWRRWEILCDLLQRLKARTRRVSLQIVASLISS